MRVLLTGFDAFADLQINPSQGIVDEIALRKKQASDIEIIAEVLPTEFVVAGNRIQELILSNSPQVVLALGVGSEQAALRLERVALNLDDSRLPDNAGYSPEGKLIIDDGPLAYFTSYPLVYLKKELQKKGIPAEISNHAGTYVCNHVFYLALHQIKKLGLDPLCGFIHLPLISDLSSPIRPPKTTLWGLVSAIEDCLKLLIDIKR